MSNNNELINFVVHRDKRTHQYCYLFSKFLSFLKFLNWAFLFYFQCSRQEIKIADDWIRTVDLLHQRQLFYQLYHNDCHLFSFLCSNFLFLCLFNTLQLCTIMFVQSMDDRDSNCRPMGSKVTALALAIISLTLALFLLIRGTALLYKPVFYACKIS